MLVHLQVSILDLVGHLYRKSQECAYTKGCDFPHVPSQSVFTRANNLSVGVSLERSRLTFDQKPKVLRQTLDESLEEKELRKRLLRDSVTND